MIKIKKSETADTRTCDWSKVSKEQLLESSKMHINDVMKGLEYIKEFLSHAIDSHDVTKISHIDMFYEDFKTGFKKQDWWKLHQKVERHHLSNPEYVQDDVNLIDVIEMIVDGVMAGMARSGEYRREKLPDGLLEKAFENTIKLLLENVEIDITE